MRIPMLPVAVSALAGFDGAGKPCVVLFNAANEPCAVVPGDGGEAASIAATLSSAVPSGNSVSGRVFLSASPNGGCRVALMDSAGKEANAITIGKAAAQEVMSGLRDLIRDMH